MTLEKPPRGKPVKMKFIMEILRKNYSRDYKSTHLKLAASSSLEIVPAICLKIRFVCLSFQHCISCISCCTVPWNPRPSITVNAPSLVRPLSLSKCAFFLLGVPLFSSAHSSQVRPSSQVSITSLLLLFSSLSQVNNAPSFLFSLFFVISIR